MFSKKVIHDDRVKDAFEKLRIAIEQHARQEEIMYQIDELKELYVDRRKRDIPSQNLHRRKDDQPLP
jgi:hypothetical protein